MLDADWLMDGRLVVRQGAAGNRISTDTLLLAAAVPAIPGERLLDLGCGTGGAALSVATRVPGCLVTGLERDRGLADLAMENARINGLSRRLRLVVGDVARPPADLVDGEFDHVFANPPYLEAGRADLRTGHKARTAQIEGEAGLAEWLDLMVAAVRDKGRLTLIQRADRLDDVLAGLSGRAGEVTVFPLWPRAGVASKRVIVTARRGVRGPLKLSSGLVLHEDDGRFRTEANRFLDGGAWLDVGAARAPAN